MSHSWWYLSRSSGIVAWSLLAAAVLWGLLLATRVFDRNPSPKWFTDLHRFLGGAAVVFVAVHVGTIVADKYVHFGVADVLVPFASKWHPVAVAWGVEAMWLLFAVEVSSLAMRFLPRRVWHAIHLSSYGLFVSATVHGLAAGPDTRKKTFELVLSAVLALVTLLTLVRLATRKRKTAARARRVLLHEPGEPPVGEDLSAGLAAGAVHDLV
jgi:sulfoxide reductase heme-binding subunit YedZ